MRTQHKPLFCRTGQLVDVRQQGLHVCQHLLRLPLESCTCTPQAQALHARPASVAESDTAIPRSTGAAASGPPALKLKLLPVPPPLQ